MNKLSPVLNTINLATRNIIRPMNYTSVTSSNHKFPHLTSYAHELALSVVFESGFLILQIRLVLMKISQTKFKIS